MIKFFRRIRQQLMADNKTGKYLLYALGEIVLVVIGILIALSLNNWNSKRKEKEKEIALLKELSLNLDKTRQAIDLSLTVNQHFLEDHAYLVAAVENDQAYTPRLDSVFGSLPYWDSPYLTENAYQNIKSIGVEIISDPELRNHIVEMHEEILPKLLNDWDRWEWDINQSIVMPFFAKHIRGSMKDRNIAKPNDFEALKANDEFLNVLSVIYRTRIYGNTLLEQCLVKIDKLQSEIETKLKE